MSCRSRAEQQRRKEMSNRIACLLALSAASLCSANEVSNWNDKCLALAIAAGQNGIVATRPAAMVHAAIHDALNSINRRYTPYALERRTSLTASPEAAVAATKPTRARGTAYHAVSS